MRISTPLLFCCLALPAATLAADADKAIFGLNEYAQLPELELKLPAKLDTGAQTASLSARNVERFRRDGEAWVRFNIAVDGAPEQTLERPLARISRIKRRAGDYNPEQDNKSYTARPVVEMDVCLGNRLRRIEVNLTDRSAFEYPLLIGSTALSEFGALVDPSLTYVAGQPGCKANLVTAAE